MRGLARVAVGTLLALAAFAAGAGTARADDAPAPTAAEPLPAQPLSAEPPSARPAEPAAPSAAAPPPALDAIAPPPASDKPEDPTLRKVVPQRRAGVVIGVTPGIAFAGASGYPNNSRLVGNPDFYSESPLLVGTSTTYFLMGALTDYFSFGPMVNIAKFENDKWTSKGVGVGFRAEAFPLISLVPALSDSSIYGQAGIGSTELQAKGNFPSADGTSSFVGIGLHHEFRLFRFLGGHFSGGPYVEYDAIFATSAERHWASVGFRIAWYGGRVVLDKR